MNELANRVKYKRKKRKFKQSEIAKKLNISVRTYQRYEKGVNQIPQPIISELSKIFFQAIRTYILRIKKFYREYFIDGIFFSKTGKENEKIFLYTFLSHKIPHTTIKIVSEKP